MKKAIKLAVFVGILSLVLPALSSAQSTGTTNTTTSADVVSAVSKKTLKAIDKAVKAKSTNRSSKINIFSPNGGETLVVGDTYKLSYDGSKTDASSYRFYLTRDVRADSKKNGVVGAIYLGTSYDDEEFMFRVPYTIETWPGLGSGYRVVICGKKTNTTSNETCSIRGVSNKSFRIVDINGGDNGDVGPIDIPANERLTRSQYKKIEIISPNGGEKFEVGKSYEIKWKGGIPGSTVNFSLLTNTGGYSGGFSDAQFYPIILNTKNDGSERWTVPTNIPKTTYKLLVEFSRDQIPGYVDWYVESWDFSEDAFEVTNNVHTDNQN